MAAIVFGYLTVASFFLPTFANTKRQMKEARRESGDWETADSVTVAIAALIWPLVIAHYLYGTVARFFKGGK
jgi:hypothetical protein